MEEDDDDDDDEYSPACMRAVAMNNGRTMICTIPVRYRGGFRGEKSFFSRGFKKHSISIKMTIEWIRNVTYLAHPSYKLTDYWIQGGCFLGMGFNAVWIVPIVDTASLLRLASLGALFPVP